MNSINKAYKLTENIQLYDETSEALKFYCKKNKKTGYYVIFQKVADCFIPICSCEDFLYPNQYENGHLCKHIIGCMMWIALERNKGQTSFEEC